METVPVIDIAPFLDGTDPEGVAAQVAHACEEIGFFQITGHGVPEEFIQEVYDISRRFFDLPDGVKATAGQPAPEQVPGWSAVGKEGMS